MTANKRLHANAAIALLFHVGHHWRGVGEFCRSPQLVRAPYLVDECRLSVVLLPKFSAQTFRAWQFTGGC